MYETVNHTLLLSDVVDQYLIASFNDNRKYYSNFLFTAGLAHAELFKKTFYTAKNVQVEVQNDEQGFFVRKPKDFMRFLSISVEDECGRHPLLLNDKIGLEVQYTVPKGNCTKCDSDLCSIIDSNIVLRKETMNGTEYTLKTYTDRRSSGHVDTVREVLEWDAVKEVVEIVQKRDPLCVLDVYECGCPEPSVKNKQTMRECGCDAVGYVLCCNTCEPYIITSKYGYVTHSLDGAKIRLEGPRYGKLPSMLILAYQSTGKYDQGELMVPDYALSTMFDGIHYFGSTWKHNTGPNEKILNKRAWEDAKVKLMLYLAPFDPVGFRELQGIMPKWG